MQFLKTFKNNIIRTSLKVQTPFYTSWFSHETPKAGSLYERVGGKSVIEKSMKEFKLSMRAHPELEQYFIWKDEKKYIPGSTAYALNSLGGPQEYSGRNLRVSHRALKISNHYFDLGMELLEKAFKNHGVDDATVKELVKHFEEHRIEITNKYVVKKTDNDIFEEYYNSGYKIAQKQEEEIEKYKKEHGGAEPEHLKKPDLDLDRLHGAFKDAYFSGQNPSKEEVKINSDQNKSDGVNSTNQNNNFKSEETTIKNEETKQKDNQK